MRQHLPRLLRGASAAPLLVAALLGACDGVVDRDSAPAEVRLSVETLTLEEGESDTLAAAVLDEGGSPLADARVEWSSSDARIARVDAAGQVTAVAAGTAYVYATLAGVGGSALRDSALVAVHTPVVTIRRAPEAALDFGPVGSTLTLPMQVLNRRNAAVAGMEVHFAVVHGDGAVSPASVATDSAGIARATVRLGAAPGHTVVEVRAAGATTQFIARAEVPPTVFLDPKPLVLPLGCSTNIVLRVRGTDGQETTGHSAAFEALDTSVVSLTPLTGLSGTWRGVTRRVDPLRPGTTRIVARHLIMGSADTAEVRVLAQTPTRIEMDAPTPLGIGGTYTQRATVYGDGAGVQVPSCDYRIPGAELTLTSLDPEIATVSGREVTGRAPGKARIVAAHGALRDTVEYTVVNARLLPGDTTVAVGDTVRYRAVDADGNPVTGTLFRLDESQSPVYAVAKDGEEWKVVARAAGTAAVHGFARYNVGATLRVRTP